MKQCVSGLQARRCKGQCNSLKARQRSNGGEFLLSPIKALPNLPSLGFDSPLSAIAVMDVCDESVCHLKSGVLQVSRKRLETAMQVLERQNVYDPDLYIYRTALTMVRSASLNCYIFDVSGPPAPR